MTTNAKNAIMIGPMLISPSVLVFTAEAVETFLTTFLSKREVAFRRRAALFPFGILVFLVLDVFRS